MQKKKYDVTNRASVVVIISQNLSWERSVIALLVRKQLAPQLARSVRYCAAEATSGAQRSNVSNIRQRPPTLIS